MPIRKEMLQRYPKDWALRSRFVRFYRAKLKPRWDVHLIGDDDQPGYAGESLSSVLGE